ncbi:MAG: WecB/TagA/CpsF family glycosyltransferase [Deltaproteobacteria bacterium]|uniref:WecB/TagA/CpsF family glycosyltransferase n=1 Tax=Candidatus Zymogenus saltonus TaxID=2844893 RepID=A0A9D8KDI1_9DELT|nr:WecB/TagA/CpsF family glycosyltransferase [Candidatus Zymogenus saltonus]
MEEIRILDIKVNPLTTGELNREIGAIIREGRKELVLNVNVNAINQALKHPFMKELLNSAEIVFCDGHGVMLGAKILGHDIPERITYADWMWDLSAYMEAEGFSFYFLGAEEGVARAAAERLVGRFPALKVVGTRNGYFDKENGAENDAVIEGINRVSPDILVVGFGMPAQERWLKDNWERIDARVALTGGACFDFISGSVKRAPRWMMTLWLEWFFRLLLQPRRMFYRYVVGNPLFILRVILERLKRGLKK